MVRFDDRLQTVLRQPASDRHDAAVRWRQLVDLIARAGPAADSKAIGEALAVIRADTPRLDEPMRAAAARAIAALPLPFGLLECFIADQLAVSAPILAAASLDPAQWAVLLGQATPETRRFVEALHPELAATSAEMTDRLVEQEQEQRTTIGDVVARIERRRHRRPASAAPGTSELGVFRWECGPNGDIGWVEGAPRGALIGRSIVKVREAGGDRIDEAALRAFSQRAPFRDAELVLAGGGAISGRWKVSGVPAFDPADGRFAGYRGIALREFSVQHSPGAPALPLDGDSLRELVHEIKTPLNAIIGFAEIIDGQFLGPAGRRYRKRAIGIVDQARLLLAAIDDLDFVARAYSPTAAAPETTDVAGIVTRTVNRVRKAAEKRGVELVHAPGSQPVMTAIDQQTATRLVERILQAAVDLAENGERLRVAVKRAAGKVSLSVTRPRVLAGATDAVFGGEGDSIDQQPGRFSLRLARGLARIAGGEISLGKDEMTLRFPAS
ncbi:MAG: sensor histidine kinase [Sphingomicrobium sp.]